MKDCIYWTKLSKLLTIAMKATSRKSIASKASSPALKSVFKGRWRSLENNRRSHGSCAPRRVWRVFTSARVRKKKHEHCLDQSTTASRKVWTQLTCAKRKRYSTSYEQIPTPLVPSTIF